MCCGSFSRRGCCIWEAIPNRKLNFVPQYSKKKFVFLIILFFRWCFCTALGIRGARPRSPLERDDGHLVPRKGSCAAPAGSREGGWKSPPSRLYAAEIEAETRFLNNWPYFPTYWNFAVTIAESCRQMGLFPIVYFGA